MKNIGRTAGASLALFAAIFLVASPSAFAMSRIEPAIGGVAGGDTIHATDLDIPHMVSISNGYYHTIALTSDNQLYQWGALFTPGTWEDAKVPRRIAKANTQLEGKKIIAVYAGSESAMVLDSENTLYGWGYNGGGGLGDGTTESHSTGAAKVQTKGTPMEGKRIVSFAVDSFLSTALADDGSVFAWGLIASPETGVDTPKGSYVPGKLKVKGTPLEGKRVAAIDQGFLHALLLDDKGTVYAFGLNDGNQLGIGHDKASDRVEAVKVAGTPMEGKKIIAISAGNNHSVALADDGSVYTWGYSRSGQLGDGISHCGATIDSCISPPVAVPTKDTPMSGEFVTEVRAGDSYTSVTAKSGRVFVWGLESALTDEDENSDRFTPIEINTKGALGPYFETPKVSMGGRQATNVVRTGPRSLQFTAPPGQLGLVDVQIQLAVGERLLPGVFRYGSASPRAAVSMNTPGVPNGGSQRGTPLGGLGLLVVLGGIAGGVVAWRRRARLG